MTMSCWSVSKSTILPFASSPHCRPTTQVEPTKSFPSSQIFGVHESSCRLLDGQASLIATMPGSRYGIGSSLEKYVQGICMGNFSEKQAAFPTRHAQGLAWRVFGKAGLLSYEGLTFGQVSTERREQISAIMRPGRCLGMVLH